MENNGYQSFFKIFNVYLLYIIVYLPIFKRKKKLRGLVQVEETFWENHPFKNQQKMFNSSSSFNH